ncbi:glutamine synthetase catalytic region [Reticulomyxa filosa]|uniref:Glutamine synthetase catalytic region n=1 Tax=Reticulomyxa filosa TaxID=46433 RepID=X6PD87_RETFI|nr:glutamine synthetase catalytic region [Reticulomyxa filosa]|eukprot:ETO36073.1 glutamine synthetase catalytic region [Reticulomyxa filosa]
MLGKRFDRDFFQKSVLKDGTHACNYLLTCDMDMNPQQGFEYANWKRGYGDFHLCPDYSTWRVLSWLPSTGIVLCDIMDPHTHELLTISKNFPLFFLKKKKKFRKQVAKAEKMGFVPNMASELEYYIFDTPFREARSKKYHDLSSAGFQICLLLKLSERDYAEDYHIQQGTRTEWLNAQFRISPPFFKKKKKKKKVECTKGEAGIGQHELNIEYSTAVEMADRHVLYKQCLHEVADLNEVSVTFMAKPYTNSTGSGCHIHCSLFDNANKRNLFQGQESIGKIKGCSPLFKHFLAGWIHYTPQLFPFFAPTVNSYKRFVSNSWAPTRCAWSYDNRSAGFRVVGSGNSLRIEMRICGADVNPYLAFAGSLASGLAGIEQELQPPEAADGDIYNVLFFSNIIASHLEQVPTKFDVAIAKLRDSKWANDTLGEDVVNHYTHFYQLENDKYLSHVSDWERARYFEMI